ncbi:MAG: hypothetical protein QNI86_04855 [Halieaceae bacterium]|nr:hypothetical protein [Halieaceae bacterium]
MTAVDLSQFASLFEIGFALHFAVAFLDRIYARELPVRINGIAARAKALEQLKRELSEDLRSEKEAGATTELSFAYRTISNPAWTRHNDHVLDRVYALMQDSQGQMKALKRILNVLTFLSILVVLYSVTALFLIGLGVELVKGLDPMTASAVVLTQLLPLPIAATIFFFVARRMSQEIDRKIRGVGELQLMLNDQDTTTAQGSVSVDQVYQRDRELNVLVQDA